MSAFMVSKQHIDFLVSYAFRQAHDPRRQNFYYTYGGQLQKIEPTEGTKLGRILWAENARSLVARYEDRMDDQMFLVNEYQYQPPKTDGPYLDSVSGLKMVKCFEYQSCESEDWESTEAYAICRAIIAHLIDRLPGYDAAPWGV